MGDDEVELGDLEHPHPCHLRVLLAHGRHLPGRAVQRGPAGVADRRRRPAGVPVDELADAAEAGDVLQLGHHAVGVDVEVPVELLGPGLGPQHPDAGAVPGRSQPVHPGDLPLGHLQLAAEHPGGVGPQRAGALAVQPHRLLAVPRAGDDAPAGAAVDDHGQPDAALHHLEGRPGVVADAGDAGVHGGWDAPDGGAPGVHAVLLPSRATPPAASPRRTTLRAGAGPVRAGRGSGPCTGRHRGACVPRAAEPTRNGVGRHVGARPEPPDRGACLDGGTTVLGR